MALSSKYIQNLINYRTTSLITSLLCIVCTSDHQFCSFPFLPQQSILSTTTKVNFSNHKSDHVTALPKIHQDIAQRKRRSPHNRLQDPILFAHCYDSLVSSTNSFSFVHCAPTSWVPCSSSKAFLPQDFCTVLR